MADHQPGLLAPWNATTLLSLAESAAAEAPKRAFLTDCPAREAWNGIEPRSLSFDGFLKAARFLGAQLRTLGIAPGECVLILLPNCVEASIALLGCHASGVVPALAPADERVDTLRAAAERAGAVAILTCAKVGEVTLGDKARQVAAKVMAIRCVAGFGFDLPDGIVSLEGWSAEDVVEAEAPAMKPDDAALITFGRESAGLYAARRSHAQLLAEALAMAPILPLDEAYGLISLMHPGAAASVAASLTLPLIARAGVRLVGPFESAVFDQVSASAPGACLYVPDHFPAGGPASEAPTLALTRASSPDGAVMPSGGAKATLIVDFDERAMLPSPLWPSDGKLAFPSATPHPVKGVLAEGTIWLDFSEVEKGSTEWRGFGAATLLRRGAGAAEKAA
jgi:hypothetical protein